LAIFQICHAAPVAGNHPTPTWVEDEMAILNAYLNGPLLIKHVQVVAIKTGS